MPAVVQMEAYTWFSRAARAVHLWFAGRKKECGTVDWGRWLFSYDHSAFYFEGTR